jgi:hypothetical protein
VNEKGCCKNQSEPANLHLKPPEEYSSVSGRRSAKKDIHVLAWPQAMLTASLDTMAAKRIPTKMSWPRRLISVRVGLSLHKPPGLHG